MLKLVSLSLSLSCSLVTDLSDIGKDGVLGLLSVRVLHLELVAKVHEHAREQSSGWKRQLPRQERGKFKSGQYRVSQAMKSIPFLWQYSFTLRCSESGASVRMTTCDSVRGCNCPRGTIAEYLEVLQDIKRSREIRGGVRDLHVRVQLRDLRRRDLRTILACSRVRAHIQVYGYGQAQVWKVPQQRQLECSLAVPMSASLR